MDHEQFRNWLSRVDDLTVAQCEKVATVLSALRCRGGVGPVSQGALAGLRRITEAAALDIKHESLNASAGEVLRGALHIQTVNSRHSQIKAFLRRFRGIATKCLDSCPRWFHLVALRDRPSIAKSLSCGSNEQTLPAIHELSLRFQCHLA